MMMQRLRHDMDIEGRLIRGDKTMLRALSDGMNDIISELCDHLKNANSVLLVRRCKCARYGARSDIQKEMAELRL